MVRENQDVSSVICTLLHGTCTPWDGCVTTIRCGSRGTVMLSFTYINMYVHTYSKHMNVPVLLISIVHYSKYSYYI